MAFGDRLKKAFGLNNKESELQDNSADGDCEEIIDKVDKFQDNEEEAFNHNEGVRNFKYLDNLISGGAERIVLDSDIILDDDELPEYESGIVVDNDIVIDGAGHSIDANGKARVFRLKAEKIVLKNMTFKNGYNYLGGALFIYDSNVTIENCCFKDSNAFGNGGAIFSHGKVTISDSNFSNNFADEDGGAIDNHNVLEVMRSNFTGNGCEEKGGSICSNQTLRLFDCSFKDNIFNEGDSSVYKVGGLVTSNVSFDDKYVGDRLLAEQKIEKTGNFKFLHNLIKTGVKEIVLDSDIIWDDDSDYPEGIEIDVNDIVIDGNGHRMDAKQKARFFKVTGENVTLKNIVFENGFISDNGSAINNSGTLNLERCTFSKNWTLHTGGIIENEGNITVSDCKFDNNNTSNAGGVFHNRGRITIFNSILSQNKSSFGAAITNEGEAFLKNCDILDNESNLFNGVINNYGDMEIIDCKINENNANNGQGGAITNEGKLLIRGSHLKDNNAISGTSIYNRGMAKMVGCEIAYADASKNGGAIFNESGELIMDSLILNGNNVQNEESSIIYVYGGSVRIQNSEISNNSSPKNLIVNNDVVKIYNTLFKNNASKNLIVNADESDSVLSMENVNFKYNLIGKTVICNNGSSAVIAYSSFENNLASEGSLNIYNKTHLTLKRIKIAEGYDTIVNEGTMVIKDMPDDFKRFFMPPKFYPSSEFNFSHLNRLIQENNANEIHLKEDISLDDDEIDFFEGGIELSQDNLIIDGNGKIIDGAGKSRIFIVTGKNIILKNIVFKNGFSHNDYDAPYNSHGAALLVNSYCNLKIENCKFINNESEANGGVIYNRGRTQIINSELSDNQSNIQGGVAFNHGYLDITECLLKGNVTYNGGGAIFNLSEMRISNSLFKDNKAKVKLSRRNPDSIVSHLPYRLSYGGAINNYNELKITGCRFESNCANNEGGAIANNVNSKMTIINCEFRENSSKIANAGAIANGGILDIYMSEFSDNVSQQCGGAIANLEEGILNLNDCIFSHNYAYSEEVAGGGGAMLIFGKKVHIKKCRFLNNRSCYLGGGIFYMGSQFEVMDCIFENNKSIAGENQIYNNTGIDLNISNTTFS